LVSRTDLPYTNILTDGISCWSASSRPGLRPSFLLGILDSWRCDR